jgi:hypothetical protein
MSRVEKLIEAQAEGDPAFYRAFREIRRLREAGHPDAEDVVVEELLRHLAIRVLDLETRLRIHLETCPMPLNPTIPVKEP